MRRLFLCLILAINLAGCGGGDQGRDADVTPVAEAAAPPTATPPPAPRPPTPTFVPTVAAGQAAVLPTSEPPPPPTETPAAPTEAPAAPMQAPTTQGAGTIRLEDTAWTGSWRNKNGSSYGGRTATWIYGAGTRWNSMQATVNLPAGPSGSAHLAIEGMDDEWEAKTEIEISVNGTPIHSGPNPLPNDDQPLEQGTWATHQFPFDAALLRAGSNTITIVLRTPGTFGQPPFFMLDYADLVTGGS